MKSRTISRTLTDPRKYEPLLAIRNEQEYDAAVARLNELVDEVGDKPRDRRYRFIETLSVLIEAYDEAWNRQDLDAVCACHTDDVGDQPRMNRSRSSMGSS